MKKKTKRVSTSLSAIFFSVVLMFSVFSVAIPMAQAETAQQKWNRLKEEQERLENQINSAEKQADHLHAHANSLRDAIAELNEQVASTQKKINLLDSKIQFLDVKLQKSKAELERQKELLRASMRALYKRGDASAVELIVASENFSEFMDEQEYLDRLKDAIHESANRVVELQLQIQKQKNEQVALRQEQVGEKRALEETRQKRKRLLAETQGQEAGYRALVARRQEQLRKAEEAISRISFGSGTPVSSLDPIGRVGCSGSACLGTHLHLEARVGSSAACDARVNPNTYFNNGTWKKPVPGGIGLNYNESGSYGGYACGVHKGVDFPASLGSPYGTPVRPVAAGVVVARDCFPEFGWMVIIDHPASGIRSMYAHMIPPPGVYCG